MKGFYLDNFQKTFLLTKYSAVRNIFRLFIFLAFIIAGYTFLKSYDPILNFEQLAEKKSDGDSGIIQGTTFLSVVSISVNTKDLKFNPNFVDSILNFYSSKNVDLVVFPLGYAPDLVSDNNKSNLTVYRKLACKYGLNLVVSFFEFVGEDVSPKSYVISNFGEILGSYSQTHKFQHENISVGNDINVIKTKFGNLGIKIATDIFYPEIDAIYKSQGADFIIYLCPVYPMEDPLLLMKLLKLHSIDFDLPNISCGYGSSTMQAKFWRYGSISKKHSLSMVIEDGSILSMSSISGHNASAILRLDYSKHPVNNSHYLPDFLVSNEIDRDHICLKQQLSIALEPHDLDVRFGSKDFFNSISLVGLKRPDILITYEYSDQITGKLGDLRRLAELYKMNIIVTGKDYSNKSKSYVISRNGVLIDSVSQIGKDLKSFTPHVVNVENIKIGIRICGDKNFWQLDRFFFLKNVDLVVNPDQSWGEGAIYLNDIDDGRACLNGFNYVCSRHLSDEYGHLSRLVSRYGEVIGQSQHQGNFVVFDLLLCDHPATFSLSKVDIFYYFKDFYLHSLLNLERPKWKSNYIPSRIADFHREIRSSRRTDLYTKYAYF